MTYVLYGALAYLVIGAGLTRLIFSGPGTPRGTFKDFVIGSLIIPVVSVALLIFILFEKLWARLLIALDYEPPENMRAGPLEPPGQDSDSPKSK
jgi:hypothetical protein